MIVSLLLMICVYFGIITKRNNHKLEGRMVKFYCDKCKQEIKRSDYELRFDVMTNNTKLEPLHKMGELCKKCACELGEMISSFL